MSDPNGKEAGLKYLEENKTKPGVIVLPSGLQYKVLNEGAGLEHPTVSTPCECHYAGRLLDGSEFDSSYKRGQPTTFAPNQVIKGWTEAMQLMVVGDKWEMYIPMELAYGPNGKPPKIPPAATLIFVMEIVKIKGETKPKEVVFPEWTPEQLALWTPKDEAAVQTWRDARLKKWEGGDANLADKYPTREALDAWLDKQSKASKDKSLWKRTHAKPKEPTGAAGATAAAAATPAAPPTLTKVSARALLTKALDAFQEPANKEKLVALVKQGDAQPEMRTMLLLPAVQEILTPAMKEFGYGPDALMTLAMQLMSFGGDDPSIAADTAKLMKAAQGDLSDFL